MTLTINQMKRIILDLTDGKKTSIEGPEVDEFIKEYEKELKSGYVIEIPFEILEDIDEDDTLDFEDEDIETLLDENYYNQPKAEKGGPGSGHFGHQGRPGEVGGSLPSGATFPGLSGDIEKYNMKSELSGHSVDDFLNGLVATDSKGMDAELTDENRAYLEGVLKHIPQEALDSVRQVVVCQEFNSFVILNAKAEDVDLGSMDASQQAVYAQYCSSIGAFTLTMRNERGMMVSDLYIPLYAKGMSHFTDMLLDNDAISSASESAIAHEFGHALFARSGTKGKSIWETAYMAKIVDHFTPYSTTHPDEGFAESYAAYTSYRAFMGHGKKFTGHFTFDSDLDYLNADKRKLIESTWTMLELIIELARDRSKKYYGI